GPMTFAPVSVLLAPESLKPKAEPATSSLIETRVAGVGSASADASPKVAGAAVPPIVIVSVVLSAATEMLPLPVSTEAGPPASVRSLALRPASVDTWPTPLPNVMFKVGLAPIVMVSVLPDRPWVRRLVGLVTPAVMPSSDRSPADVPVVSIAVLALALVSTSWLDALIDAETFVVPDWRLTALAIVCALEPGAIAVGVPW